MNQHSVTDFSVERGYLVVKREWKDGDVLEYHFDSRRLKKAELVGTYSDS